MPKPVPLTKEFIRNGLAPDGWIIPPPEERRINHRTLGMIAVGLLLTAVAFVACAYALLMP